MHLDCSQLERGCEDKSNKASALPPKLYLLSLLSVVFADANTGPYPLGISFGPRYIKVAYIDSDDKPVTVTSIKGNDEYRAFMEDTERNEGVIVYVGRFAYGFNSCEGFGLYPKNCNVEDDVPPIIFADYNEEYLQIMLAEVGEFTFGDLDSVRLPSLGAKRLLDNNLDEYRLELQSAIQDFKDRDSLGYIESVGEIVMSGEVPKPAFEIFRDAIAAVLPHHVGMIRDSIDPLFTDAVGAAEFAKFIALNPEKFGEICIAHDEL
ncbi:hypothetical protein A7D00_6495 [Trichophyton violaceum]|uniref:Uncharacterized protein n=1 Tax=Trichophyton violaceum TaxID=34388 RepID=A0A178FBR3_TRIVO|nr:hypothetical protein A7D00_6495 [Trichophyton violaceum]